MSYEEWSAEAEGAGEARPPPEPDQSPPTPGEGEAAEASERAQDLEHRLRRALADLDNLRRRSAREVTRQRADERLVVASQWLPVVDNLQLALHHAEEDHDALATGLRAVVDQALQVLSALGFPAYDDVGRPFDPLRDEAVSVIDSDKPAGTVVAAVRSGYGSDGVILRPAGVVVARQPG